MGNLKTGFVHTVYFWLKDTNNADHKAALHKGLIRLSEIEEIGTAYVGTPAPTDREVIDNTYDFSITFIFDSPEKQDVYQDHADHHAFIAACSSLWERVRVYDAVNFS